MSRDMSRDQMALVCSPTLSNNSSHQLPPSLKIWTQTLKPFLSYVQFFKTAQNSLYCHMSRDMSRDQMALGCSPTLSNNSSHQPPSSLKIWTQTLKPFLSYAHFCKNGTDIHYIYTQPRIIYSKIGLVYSKICFGIDFVREISDL